MTKSIARDVARGGSAVLAGTLILVGVATATVLYRRESGALDQALLVAAHGRAHPDVEVEVEVEHSRSPIDAWVVASDGGRLPSRLIKKARHAKGPTYSTLGDQRVVLLPFEVEDREDGHLLAVAAAPDVTVAASVGPFGLIYGSLAALALLAGIWIQHRVVRRAFKPVDRARERASRLTGFGADQRLDVDSPIEVQPLLEALNGVLERLDRSYQAQSRFTAEAAHELRTPVTAMLGELDVTLRSPRSEEAYRDLLTSLRDDVLRLRALVEGLTALTRVDAGDLGRGRERVRAGEIASSALSAESATLAAAGNTVSLQIEDDPEFDAQRSLVVAALGNLLRNAARHAPGTEVRLGVAQRGELVELVVDDAGPGVDEAEREVLFDRFVRGATARDVDRQGLGLGLAITREVARRHGGDCVLESSPLGGLRARLTLSLGPPAES